MWISARNRAPRRNDMNWKGKLPEEGYVRIKTILEVLPISRATWYQRMHDDPEWPKPVKANRIAMWRVGEIRTLLDRLGGE
jgi:predicted DNA-binding transcriptional regulator AlpA